MGFLDKFNVKKQVDEHMKKAAEQHEKLMNLDRSDPDAMRRYTDQKNAEILNAMPAWMKKTMPASQMENIRKMQQDAIEKQAEFYRKAQDKDEKKSE